MFFQIYINTFKYNQTTNFAFQRDISPYIFFYFNQLLKEWNDGVGDNEILKLRMKMKENKN